MASKRSFLYISNILIRLILSLTSNQLSLLKLPFNLPYSFPTILTIRLKQLQFSPPMRLIILNLSIIFRIGINNNLTSIRAHNLILTLIFSILINIIYQKNNRNLWFILFVILKLLRNIRNWKDRIWLHEVK